MTTHPRETEDERPDYPTDDEWRAMQDPDLWEPTGEEAFAELVRIFFGEESK